MGCFLERLLSIITEDGLSSSNVTDMDRAFSKTTSFNAERMVLQQAFKQIKIKKIITIFLIKKNNNEPISQKQKQ